MDITLKCSNKECSYGYKVSEKELEEYGETYHSKCLICGSKLEIVQGSINDLVKFELFKRAEEHLYKWFNQLGLEGTLELVERHSNQACYRIYKELLEKRGFKINEKINQK